MRKSAFFAAALAVVLVVPIAVYASHQFDDVPPSHTFHNSIAWMADNGITVGCDADEYCPDDFVTRGQMSAFMKRLAEKQVVDAGTLSGYGHAEFVGSEVRVRTEVANVPASGTVGIVASCEPGEVLIGGGAGLTGSSPDVKASRPWPNDDGAVPTGWQATAQGAGSSGVDLEVHALCASYPSDS